MSVWRDPSAEASLALQLRPLPCGERWALFTPACGCDKLLPGNRRARDAFADRMESAAGDPAAAGGFQLRPRRRAVRGGRAEEHTSELQSRLHLVCRLLL